LRFLFRDVAAQGPFPLVLFSHGNDGIRFQSFFFARISPATATWSPAPITTATRRDTLGIVART
jgi:hypothetical protein